AAMVYAKDAGRNPRELAEAIVEKLDVPKGVEGVEVAGPGFINFKLSDAFFGEIVTEILDQGYEYGKRDVGDGEYVQVEFVSANPTGPLNAVNARQAAYGDALTRALKFTGYQVETEYLVNDIGTQVDLFTESVQARMAEELGRDGPKLPDAGYKGEYVRELAKELLAEKGETLVDDKDAITEKAVAKIVEDQKNVLTAFKVEFDNWFHQSSMYPAFVEETLEVLEGNGAVYERGGAKWARTAAEDDDEDRVLVRADGRPTYFLADLAYHLDKRRRGYDKAIVVLGPDHHGHQKRMYAGMRLLGIPDGWLEIVLNQQVNMLSAGETMKMSKRAGALVEMTEVIDEIEVDAARFFFLMRSHTAHLDFDIELAKQETLENPVYYAQYCHARVASLAREAAKEGWDIDKPAPDLSVLDAPEERLLMRKLWEFGGVVEAVARYREPHRLTTYLTELAGQFHGWYQKYRVLQAETRPLGEARLTLARAAGQVVRNGLRLLGVEAPERM
ncbi:MAG: arginine--tRNA ligase, partial [Candidatus Coatesbacteria bacterium]